MDNIIFIPSACSVIHRRVICMKSFCVFYLFFLSFPSFFSYGAAKGGGKIETTFTLRNMMSSIFSSSAFHTALIVWRWFQWEKAHVSLSHFHFYHFFLPRILPNYRLPEARHKLLSTGLSLVFLRRFRISLFRRHRVADAQSRGCIKLKAFNTSPPRLMPSFFSYVLWLEYVFKHALLCRHKIYVITRQEQILFFQVRGRKILCAFNFPALVLVTKLLGRIFLLLLPFNDHDFRLTWLRGCERLENLIYCPPHIHAHDGNLLPSKFVEVFAGRNWILRNLIFIKVIKLNMGTRKYSASCS